MADPVTVFDRATLRRRRDRAAAGFKGHDFLFREVAARLVERLGDVRRRFPLALDLGAHGGLLAEALAGRFGIERLVQTDLSTAMLRAAQGPRVAADEEALPFAPGVFDLALSLMSLHWANDLSGVLVQTRRSLRADGLFLAAMFGVGTLRELRESLADAEIAVEGGASPRVSPFVEVRDAGALLQRAGFALPVVDRDPITVSYPDALALMRDLRGMGETNALAARPRTPARRETLARAAAIYAERFAGRDGRIPATFEIVYLIGWAPHADQPKPLKPGSAAASLAEALGAADPPIPPGEK